MPLHIGWFEIATRLGFAFVAALLVGLNRGRHRGAAGLRTTLLVCLAAAVSMVQVNLLLGMDGKTPGSFAVLDLMRLPLGILTGMGFIGGGAILKRGNLVLGVTTAASLWFTTVMGLCFGGGQIGLGLISLALGLFILTVLKWFEDEHPREHRAVLSIVAGPEGPAQDRIESIIRGGGAKPLACSLSYRPGEQIRKYELIVAWRACKERPEAPDFVAELARDSALRELTWVPDSMGSNRAENIPSE